MRIILYILSFYFLGLTFLPCTDADVGKSNSDLSTTVVDISLSDNHDMDHSQSTASDLCPPFCTCHCCHIHTIDFGMISFVPLSPEISVMNTPYFDNIVDEVLQLVLDPPRV